jgi:hypothetical protein
MHKGMNAVRSKIILAARAPSIFACVIAGMFLILAGCGSEPAESVTVSKADASTPAPSAAPVADSSKSSDGGSENQPPEIIRISFEPDVPRNGESLEVVVEVEDPEGDPIHFRYRWTIAGQPYPRSMSVIDDLHAFKGDLVEVEVTVNDGRTDGTPARLEADVANTPPRLVGLSIHPADEILSGMEILARPDARDADGDEISFEFDWSVNGRPVSESGPRFSTESLKRGDVVQLRVVAADLEDESKAMSTPELRIVNAPPRVVSLPEFTSKNGAFHYTVRAEDPDGDTAIQFHLDQGPEGMTIDIQTGELSWKPRSDQAGTQAISVIVDDLHGGRSKHSFDVTVEDPQGSSSPASMNGN